MEEIRDFTVLKGRAEFGELIYFKGSDYGNVTPGVYRLGSFDPYWGYALFNTKTMKNVGRCDATQVNCSPIELTN